jgi:hypothetical protein
MTAPVDRSVPTLQQARMRRHEKRPAGAPDFDPKFSWRIASVGAPAAVIIGGPLAIATVIFRQNHQINQVFGARSNVFERLAGKPSAGRLTAGLAGVTLGGSIATMAALGHYAPDPVREARSLHPLEGEQIRTDEHVADTSTVLQGALYATGGAALGLGLCALLYRGQLRSKDSWGSAGFTIGLGAVMGWALGAATGQHSVADAVRKRLGRD